MARGHHCIGTILQDLLVNSSVPANDLREFIAQAKSKPGELDYASYGTGTPSHLAGEFYLHEGGGQDATHPV